MAAEAITRRVSLWPTAPPPPKKKSSLKVDCNSFKWTVAEWQQVSAGRPFWKRKKKKKFHSFDFLVRPLLLSPTT